MKNNGTFGLIDDLTISYDGNQLVKVTDDAEALNYNGALDFNDGDDSTCEYDYDSNGALTRDSNRGINSITYDYGHHVYKVNLNMTSEPRNIRKDYTPDGRKLSSTHLTHIPTVHGYYTKTTKELYIDGLILRGDTTLLWQFGGGYVSLNDNGTPTSWNYYVTDHLGSTRMVVDSNDSIKETISYYPFGSEMKMENPALLNSNSWQRFRFTGKELDRQNSLNMYDFGARWYDVAGVPMWTSVDPLCEKYYSVSPYAYCAGNPVNAIDLGGKEVFALNPLARRNICNTLTKEEMAYVRFLSNGMLDIDLLNKCNSSSNNFSSLRILGNSSTKYYFSVAEKDLDGIPFYEKGTNNDNPSNFRYGITHLPGAENSPSPNDNVYIYTASFLDEKTQARNTAHEAFGHALFYELSKEDSKYIPYHTYGVVDKAIEHDPVNGDYEYSIFGKTNKLLEEQIKVVEQEAIDNYERNH